jgi:hypothetical protein
MAVCGYQTSNGNEHVIFINSNQQLYELVYKNKQWHYTDLTAQAKNTGAGPAATKSPLVGYQTSNGYEHINYVGEDQHIHELIYTDKWKHNDLTTLANNLKHNSAPLVTPGSALVAYQTSNGYEHVFFIGENRDPEKNNRIYELIYTKDWVSNEISKKHQTGPYSTALTGFRTSNGDEHVFYNNTFIYELIYTNNNWKDNFLGSPLTDKANPSPDSNLAGLVTSNGNEHVFFVDRGGYVHELIYASLDSHEVWADNRIGKVATSAGTPLDAYQTSNGYEHVNYIDNAKEPHVRELIYAGEWKDATDLNTAIKSTPTSLPNPAPPADPTKGLAGYQTSNGYEHVNYMDEKFQVYELLYANREWICNNLTSLANVPAVAELALAGD